VGAKVGQLHRKSHRLVKLHHRDVAGVSHIKILKTMAIFGAALQHQPNFTGTGIINRFP